MKRKFSLLVALACFCGGGGGGGVEGGWVANAQLFIHVYPSQDNPTSETIWIFSGSSTAGGSDSIRTQPNANINRGDSWEIDYDSNSGNLYNANKPNDQVFSLSSLFSSSNTKDIASVNARIPSGGKTNIIFAANATNTPTITIGSGSRTISHLFMDEDSGDRDDIGTRVSGSALSYSTGNSSAWVGAGILSKPIGDFHTGTFNNPWNSLDNEVSPNFAAASVGSVRVVINSQIIPEPEEYAIVFALFALGFVPFHRHFQKKKQRQPAAAT